MSHFDSSLKWGDVPGALVDEWRALFEDSREGLDLAAECPNCGAEELHRWFDLNREEPSEAQGESWLGRGGQWQWCSRCHIYEHSSGLVPTWWCEQVLAVDPELLRDDPGPIEEARVEAEG